MTCTAGTAKSAGSVTQCFAAAVHGSGTLLSIFQRQEGCSQRPHRSPRTRLVIVVAVHDRGKHAVAKLSNHVGQRFPLCTAQGRERTVCLR